MFTGIIEALRPVVGLARGTASGALTIDLGPLAADAHMGDSIAINGICLTAERIDGACAVFDVSAETLSKTAFAAVRTGDQVNVERSLPIGGRLGGHFVTGHIDGVGWVESKRQDPGQWTFQFRVPLQLANMIIEKGSVAIDGISLTVIDLRADTFSAAVIPHTLANSTLGLRSQGDMVNVETDVLGKWVQHLMAAPNQASPSALTVDRLREAGFI